MSYTEFYCQSGGSNLNAGSTNNNTAAYTSTNGNWNGSTIFTPTDGSTPASSVSVGDWASIYLDAASVTVSVSRVTAVAAGVNGAITVSGTARIGTVPASGATGRTIKVGGAWLGPNAASGFPFTLSGYGKNQNSSGQTARANLKNDQTYSLTASFAYATGAIANVTQGYTSSVGDGGKATFDGGTSTGAILSDVGTGGNSYIDLVFKTSITSGTTDLITVVRNGNFIRCVFTGARQRAILTASSQPVSIRECEFYDCNKSNTANTGIVYSSGQSSIIKSFFHDNPGSNVIALRIVSNMCDVSSSVFSGTGKYGVQVITSQNGYINIDQCDFYNSGSDAINNDSTSVNPVWIENCNFIKNAGKGINNANTTTGFFGYVYNCGYGSGTMANGSSDTLNNFISAGAVTYASDVTPWSDPDNGVFDIVLAAAISAGRGAFTTTASSYGPTVGYPDIGAAQALVTAGGGEVSYGFAS